MTNTPTWPNMRALLGCFVFILLIHALHLPVWVSVACFAFGLWFLGIERQKLPCPPLMVLAPLTIVMAVGIMLTFGGQLNKYSGLSLLIVMAGLKLLETKTKRDFVIVVIAMYLLVGYLFLFSQSLLNFLLSVIAILLLTSSLLQLHMHHTIGWLSLMKQSAKMMLLATPFMLVLFVLFPRANAPLWGGLQTTQTRLGLPGLSKRIELNKMSLNVQDNRVAFRVQFDGLTPPNQAMYWRGPVLWTMVGDQWLAADPHDRPAQEQVSVSGQAYRYRVTLEPNEHEWLLMLEMPAQAPPQGKFTKDHAVQRLSNRQERLQYEGTSYPSYKLGPSDKLSRNTRRMALQIDMDANPRTFDMASAWSHLSKPEIVQMALDYFKQNPFTYSLNPTVAKRDVIDAFLFNTRRGFCEHYATSFVTMMRSAGVPARVVTGYQGGEKNGDYFIIRQSDAHAWAEVWLDQQGWVRVDPTATIAPERVEQGISVAIEKSIETQATTNTEQSPSPTLPATLRIKQYPRLHRAFLAWDNIEHRWNQTIISYNQSRQQNMLQQLTKLSINPVMLSALLIVFLLSVLGVTLWLMWRASSPKLTPTQQAYARFIKLLTTYQLTPNPTESALDFARRVGQQLPQLQQQAIQIATLYNYLMYSRYADHESATHLQRFKSLISQFADTLKSTPP